MAYLKPSSTFTKNVVRLLCIYSCLVYIDTYSTFIVEPLKQYYNNYYRCTSALPINTVRSSLHYYYYYYYVSERRALKIGIKKKVQYGRTDMRVLTYIRTRFLSVKIINIRRPSPPTHVCVCACWVRVGTRRK